MPDSDRMKAIDEQLLLAAEQWMRTEARERATAINLAAAHESRHNRGDLDKESKAGDELRRRIREAEDHARAAQDQALKIRREILGPNHRGPGKKAPVEEPPKPRDPATQALIDKREKERRERSERGRLGAEAARALKTCEACGSEMEARLMGAHAETCVS